MVGCILQPILKAHDQQTVQGVADVLLALVQIFTIALMLHLNRKLLNGSTQASNLSATGRP